MRALPKNRTLPDKSPSSASDSRWLWLLRLQLHNDSIPHAHPKERVLMPEVVFASFSQFTAQADPAEAGYCAAARIGMCAFRKLRTLLIMRCRSSSGSRHGKTVISAFGARDATSIAVGERTGMRRAQLAVRRSRGGYLLGSARWIGPSKLNSTPPALPRLSARLC